ncbi:MAG TPA: MFS transporter [Spirochaetota bacterium]|nr:MFS transporter [Spirochaetota bacterium]HPS87161.1 MFS transporter [Spirochaetota bacterium]
MRNLKPSSALRALKNRDYRLFFFGQGVSLIGTWMQSIAASWLIYRLTGSALMLGLAGFLGQIPVFLISPFAGVLGDRLSRHRILMAVQILSMLQAFSFAIVTLTGVVQVWHILLLSCILGIINAFEMPVRQAFVIEMIKDKSDLPNAIALNSSIFNASRLIGPAIAGIIVAAAGEGICFLINGISYIAVIAAYLSMNVVTEKVRKTGGNVFADLKDGFFYAAGFVPIRDLLILIAGISLFGMTFPVLLPVFAAKIFGGGSHIFGMLVSATGAGAFLATVYLAMRKSIQDQGRVMNIGVYTLALSLMAFSYSEFIFLSVALLVITGFSMIVVIASCNMLIQAVVDEDKRGRVMSFYVMAFSGAAPIGSLLSGALSSKTGAPMTVFICGAACLALGIVFSFRLPVVSELIKPILAGKNK